MTKQEIDVKIRFQLTAAELAANGCAYVAGVVNTTLYAAANTTGQARAQVRARVPRRARA